MTTQSDLPDILMMLDMVDQLQRWADWLKDVGNETSDFWVCSAAPLVNNAAAALRGAAGLLNEVPVGKPG